MKTRNDVQDTTPDEVLNNGRKKKLERELNKRAARVTGKDEQRALDSIPDKVQRVAESAAHKAPFVSRLIGNVKTLFALMRDRSFSLETGTRAIIVAALVYFLSPVDVFPDFIPILGYIDDAFVISLVIHQLESEIQRYRDRKADKTITSESSS